MLLLGAARWLHCFTLMLLFGNAMLRSLLPGPAPPTPARKLLAPIALLAACWWLAATAQQMTGTGLFDPVALQAVLSQSLFGQVFAARAVLLILLCAAMLQKRESVIAALAGAALALIAVTSHAAEASPAHFTAIGITSDALHLLTAGFWAGGLSVLATLFMTQGDHAPAVRQFSSWAMVAVAVLLLTGMLNASNILLGGDGSPTPLYVEILAAKLVLVVLLLGLATYNQMRLLPQLPDSSIALKRHIAWEMGLIGLVLVLVSALTGLSPGA